MNHTESEKQAFMKKISRNFMIHTASNFIYRITTDVYVGQKSENNELVAFMSSLSKNERQEIRRALKKN